jgi:hypothetical protein
MEKTIYHVLGTPSFKDIKNSGFWEIGEFHSAVKSFDGIEYLGRNTPLNYRNGTATYRLRNVDITHFQEIEPKYEIIEVKLNGDDKTDLSVVEKIIQLSINKRMLEEGAKVFGPPKPRWPNKYSM